MHSTSSASEAMEVCGGRVVQHLVVDFVGVNDELVLTRDFDNLLQQFRRVQRAGRVVRVDHHNSARIGRDLVANIVQIRHPACTFVADIMPRRATCQTHGSGPQRIIRCGHQHFVAGIEQRLHRQHDQLGRAIADDDVVNLHPGDIFALGVMHDRLARGEQALGVAVTRRIGQVDDDILDDLFRRFKAERRGVADVQLDDALAFFFHLLGTREHRAADVIADVVELGGFAYGPQHGHLFINFHGWVTSCLKIAGGLPKCIILTERKPLPQLEKLLKFHLAQPEGLNLITGYGADYVTVNGARHSAGSLLVAPDNIIENWVVTSFNALNENHFAAMLVLKPELVLLGTGSKLQFPHPRLSACLTNAGIGMEVMDTGAACRTYNILVAEGRRAVVGLLFNPA